MITHLSDAAIAAAYLRSHGTYVVDQGAQALADDVRRYLVTSHLEHRDAFAVAAEVAKLAQRQEPAPTPAPPAPEPQLDEEWRQSQMQGVGDARPLTAQDVQGMGWEQYAEYRQRAGIGRNASSKGIFG